MWRWSKVFLKKNIRCVSVALGSNREDYLDFYWQIGSWAEPLQSTTETCDLKIRPAAFPEGINQRGFLASCHQEVQKINASQCCFGSRGGGIVLGRWWQFKYWTFERSKKVEEHRRHVSPVEIDKPMRKISKLNFSKCLQRSNGLFGLSTANWKSNSQTFTKITEYHHGAFSAEIREKTFLSLIVDIFGWCGCKLHLWLRRHPCLILLHIFFRRVRRVWSMTLQPRMKKYVLQKLVEKVFYYSLLRKFPLMHADSIYTFDIEDIIDRSIFHVVFLQEVDLARLAEDIAICRIFLCRN